MGGVHGGMGTALGGGDGAQGVTGWALMGGVHGGMGTALGGGGY